MALNRSSTINNEIQENLKQVTIANALFNCDKVLFALCMILASPRLADILFVLSQKRSTTDPTAASGGNGHSPVAAAAE